MNIKQIILRHKHKNKKVNKTMEKNKKTQMFNYIWNASILCTVVVLSIILKGVFCTLQGIYDFINILAFHLINVLLNIGMISVFFIFTVFLLLLSSTFSCILNVVLVTAKILRIVVTGTLQITESFISHVLYLLLLSMFLVFQAVTTIIRSPRTLLFLTFEKVCENFHMNKVAFNCHLHNIRFILSQNKISLALLGCCMFFYSYIHNLVEYIKYQVYKDRNIKIYDLEYPDEDPILRTAINNRLRRRITFMVPEVRKDY